MLIKQLDIFFTTISVNKRVPVFYDFEITKQIVIKSLKFLSDKGIVEIYSFVIMNEHIHLIWKINNGLFIKDIVTKFKRYTGGEIAKFLKSKNEDYLEYFISGRKDRKFKIWKINSKNIKIMHPSILKQKIEYIHLNPIKAGYELYKKPEDYFCSSASFYSTGSNDFDFLISYLKLLS